jgi:hypothetical protein
MKKEDAFYLNSAFTAAFTYVYIYIGYYLEKW